MKKQRWIFALGVLVCFSLACSLFTQASSLMGGQPSGNGSSSGSGGGAGGSGSAGSSGSGAAGSVSDLWSDVPKMDGLTKIDLELPLAARLALRTFMTSSSAGDANIAFIAFSTDQTPEAVSNFYTVDKMKAAGWDQGDQMGCQGSFSGANAEGGGVCFFARQTGENQGSLLMVFIGKDSKTSQTQVFFARVDAKNLPTKEPQ